MQQEKPETWADALDGFARIVALIQSGTPGWRVATVPAEQTPEPKRA